MDDSWGVVCGFGDFGVCCVWLVSMCEKFLEYVFCNYVWFPFGCDVVFKVWFLMWPIGQSLFLILIWFVS